VTVTTTCFSSSIVPADSTSSIGKTTTEPIVTLPWWPFPTTRLPTTGPDPTTSTIPPLTVPPIGKRDPQVLGSPTRTVLVSPTIATSARNSTHTHKTKPTTTSKYYDRRQELGNPTGSISWYTGGDDGLTVTATLIGPTKRQELGDPTGSVVWWGEGDAEPTDRVLVGPNKRERHRNRIQLT